MFNKKVKNINKKFGLIGSFLVGLGLGIVGVEYGLLLAMALLLIITGLYLDTVELIVKEIK